MSFGGATFAPDDEMASDDDGIVVLPVTRGQLNWRHRRRSGDFIAHARSEKSSVERRPFLEFETVFSSVLTSSTPPSRAIFPTRK